MVKEEKRQEKLAELNNEMVAAINKSSLSRQDVYFVLKVIEDRILRSFEAGIFGARTKEKVDGSDVG